MLSIRQKTIVRYILGHPGGVAGHQLSELLRVSGKTIRNDISDINRWMKEYEIRICASQKEGYYIPEAYRNHMMSVLENQADPDIKWEIHTPQERRLAIMGRVLGHPGIRLDQIADRFCVSEQTLYKDFIHLKNTLSETCGFNQFVMKSHCLYVQAEEYDILRLIFRLISSCIMSSGQMMDSLLMHWMQGIVNLGEIYTFYGYTVQYCREKKLIIPDPVLYISSWLIFYVNMRREEAHFLEKEDRSLPEDELSGFLQYMDKSLFLELDSCDFAFLYDYLKAIGFSAEGGMEDQEAEELAACFQEKLWKQNQIKLSEREETADLYRSFVGDLKGLILRIHLEAQLFEFTSKAEQDTLREAFGAMLLMGVLIREKYGVDVTPAELRRLSGYIEAGCPSEQLRVSIQMVTGSDSSFYYSVSRWIRNNFSENVRICGVCPGYLLESSIEKNEPDILMAVTPLNIQSSIPQITLTIPFSVEEGNRLWRFIEDLSLKKQTEFVLESFFYHDRVVFLEGNPSWEEMAGAGCRNLENTGCVRAWKEHLREFSEKEAWSKSPVANGFCFLYPREKKDLKDGISLVIARNRRSDIRVMMAAAFAPGNYGKQEALYGFFRRFWKEQFLAETLQKEKTASDVLERIRSSVQDEMKYKIKI